MDVFSRLAFCLGISLLTGAVVAQPASAEAPTLAVGDRWLYQVLDGFTGAELPPEEFQVVKVTPDGYQVVSTTAGQPKILDLTLGLNARQLLDGLSGDSGELSFPLSVGKKWKARQLIENADNRTIVLFEAERQVASIEKMKVASGEFEVYKIVSEGFWSIRSDPLQVAASYARGRTVTTAWYAPAVKRFIALETYSTMKGHAVRKTKTYLTGFEIH